MYFLVSVRKNGSYQFLETCSAHFLVLVCKMIFYIKKLFTYRLVVDVANIESIR